VPETGGPAPGEDAALAGLRAFVSGRLAGYDTNRNDPNKDAASGLSPYLHFGQLSAQLVALTVRAALLSDPALGASADAFLEQLIVRRELADNFCLHHPDYDTVDAFPAWARATLDKHRLDPRPVLYSLDELERARTDDPLWNAAQAEMVLTGRMHGYMRMYWGKKLLEWTEGPEQAMAWAVRLNDRWQLDGRDPNGYAGIAWAIGGVHDRPWPERPVFGTVRYMNSAGARRKFDVDAYVRRFPSLAGVLP
jgi:deoxyribodipyrimidine photo-lyase